MLATRMAPSRMLARYHGGTHHRMKLKAFHLSMHSNADGLRRGLAAPTTPKRTMISLAYGRPKRYVLFSRVVGVSLLTFRSTSVVSIRHPTMSTRPPNEASYPRKLVAVLATTTISAVTMMASTPRLPVRFKKVLVYRMATKKARATRMTTSIVRS